MMEGARAVDRLTGTPAEDVVREFCAAREIDPKKVVEAEVRITDGKVQGVILKFGDGTELDALPD